MIVRNGWRERLRTLVSDMGRSEKHVEYPFKRVLEIVDAPTAAALNEELTKLVGIGQLDAIYRIRSQETGAGLAEFHNLMEIPTQLFDDTADRYQKVVLGRDVELIYRAPA
ncbi:hypothetical protein [Rhizobium beringeri]|uniref:hypothetical protein n=1 Tax=Rhizobium beringeri TaxID=3019934 RepID=UPI002E1461B9|nr:hypothetical protein U8P75_23975 [Rhizobium beringeri]WSH80197.1 hypothetical protein U8P69_23810 [Rhizobium beringeri]